MMSVEFNPEVILSEEINKSMSKFASEYAIRVVIKCAKKYNFDADEAITYLKLRGTVATQPTIKKVVELKTNNANIEVETEKVGKPTISFPYNGEINTNCCFGLKLNGGLYTQCESLPKGDGFCGRCNTERVKNPHGKPTYGTIQDRATTDLLSFVDPSGRKVTPYSKYMTSKKLSRDDVFAEACKYNITINLIHFENPQEPEENSDKKKKAGGRPQTKKSVVQISDEPVLDLFEQLVKHNELKQTTTLPLPEVIRVECEDETDVKETEILKNLVIEEEPKNKDIDSEKKKPLNKKKTVGVDKEQKEAEKKAEKERKEADKKAEKERKEADKKAEKERKEAEKKTKPSTKKTEKVVHPKKVVVVEINDDDNSSLSSSESDNDDDSVAINEKLDNCYSLIKDHIQYWVSSDTKLVYDDSKYTVIGKIDPKNDKNIIFNTNDEELEEEDDYFEEVFTNDNSYGDYYDDLDRADEEEYDLINNA